jgi:hypothetical protein
MPPIWWVDTAILTRAVKATYGSSMTSKYNRRCKQIEEGTFFSDAAK